MRLSVEETLRNLKQVEEKYKIRFIPTGEVNISEMARDCIDTIEALQQENEQLNAQVGRRSNTIVKAILELSEMPENCKECLLHIWKSNTLVCKILLVNGLPHKRRDDCPLKEVSE